MRMLQVAPPLHIMVRKDCADAAWQDNAAYAIVEHVHCPPAHLVHEVRDTSDLMKLS